MGHHLDLLANEHVSYVSSDVEVYNCVYTSIFLEQDRVDVSCESWHTQEQGSSFSSLSTDSSFSDQDVLDSTEESHGSPDVSVFFTSECNYRQTLVEVEYQDPQVVLTSVARNKVVSPYLPPFPTESVKRSGQADKVLEQPTRVPVTQPIKQPPLSVPDSQALLLGLASPPPRVGARLSQFWQV